MKVNKNYMGKVSGIGFQMHQPCLLPDKYDLCGSWLKQAKLFWPIHLVPWRKNHYEEKEEDAEKKEWKRVGTLDIWTP